MATPSLSELGPQQQHAAEIMVLARQMAVRQIKAQRKRLGLRQTLPYSTLSRMAIDLVKADPAFLLEAAASPIVQELRHPHRKRRPANQGLLMCKSQVHNGDAQ